MKKSIKLALLILGLLLIAYWILNRSDYEVGVMKLPPDPKDSSTTAH